MPAAIDLSRQRFGRLVAIDKVTGGRIRSWKCLCDCGNKAVVGTNKLTSGHTRSCGCFKVETTKTNGFKNIVHGCGHGKKDPTYRSWTGMRERCRDPKNRRYFGRGITVCSRWNSYLTFLADMGTRPTGMTLDRINVNGGYQPDNCRWATPKQQQRNRVRTRYLVIDGVRISMMEVAERLDINKNAAQYFFSVARILKDEYGYIPNIESGCSVDF